MCKLYSLSEIEVCLYTGTVEITKYFLRGLSKFYPTGPVEIISSASPVVKCKRTLEDLI